MEERRTVTSVGYEPRTVATRLLRLGDSDDQFLVVEAGVKEGEEVVYQSVWPTFQQLTGQPSRPFSGVNDTDSDRPRNQQTTDDAAGRLATNATQTRRRRKRPRRPRRNR